MCLERSIKGQSGAETMHSNGLSIATSFWNCLANARMVSKGFHLRAANEFQSRDLRGKKETMIDYYVFPYCKTSKSSSTLLLIHIVAMLTTFLLC